MTDITEQVLEDEGCKRKPTLKLIRKGYGTCYSGTCYKDRIVLTKGKYAGKKDGKLVLLHELAHWLLPWGEHHSERFWDKAFELYRRYGVPMRYAKNREARYRKKASKAYLKNLRKSKSGQ
jgi:hypothetical protein